MAHNCLMILAIPTAFALIGLFIANIGRIDSAIYRWEKKRGL